MIRNVDFFEKHGLQVNSFINNADSVTTDQKCLVRTSFFSRSLFFRRHLVWVVVQKALKRVYSKNQFI